MNKAKNNTKPNGFKTMKKLFISIFILLTLFSFATSIANASTALEEAKSGLDVTAKKAQLVDSSAASPELKDIILRIIGYVLSLIGIVFMVQIILAGFKWMNAGGNPDDVKKAKETITNSIIGILIIGAAYVLTSNVFGLIGTYIGS